MCHCLPWLATGNFSCRSHIPCIYYSPTYSQPWVMDISILLGPAGLGTNAMALATQSRVAEANQQLWATLNQHVQWRHKTLGMVPTVSWVSCPNGFRWALGPRLSAGQRRRVCTLPGTSCCIYISNSGQVQTYLYQLTQDVKIIHNLTQIFEQIPRGPKITDLFSWLDSSSFGKWLGTEFQIIACIIIIGFAITIFFVCTLSGLQCALRLTFYPGH